MITEASTDGFFSFQHCKHVVRGTGHAGRFFSEKIWNRELEISVAFSMFHSTLVHDQSGEHCHGQTFHEAVRYFLYCRDPFFSRCRFFRPKFPSVPWAPRNFPLCSALFAVESDPHLLGGRWTPPGPALPYSPAHHRKARWQTEVHPGRKSTLHSSINIYDRLDGYGFLSGFFVKEIVLKMCCPAQNQSNAHSVLSLVI